MPRPTSESQPSASDTATVMGTSVTLSSNMPAVEASAMKNSTKSESSRYFFRENRLMAAATMYRSTPARSSSRKVPPISTMNATINMPVMPVSRVSASTKTITGAAMMRHRGIR